MQLATTTILARNLSAQDYGIVGFANVIGAFCIRINGLGLNTALIQRKTINETVVGTAVSLNVILSVVSFLLMQAAAPLAGHLLGSPASVPVVRVLAFGFLLSPLGFVPSCVLTREMQFAKLRIPSVIGAIARGIVAVALALSGWKHWSLVWGNLAGIVTGSVLLQIFRPMHYSWRIDWNEAKKLLSVGIPLAFVSLIGFAILNADNFFVGTFLGATALGYYTVAFNWSTFVSGSLQEIVHSVLFPKFAQIQDDTTAVRTRFLRMLRVVAFGATLLNIGLLNVAGPLLVNVLGKGTDRWMPACAVLQVLCIYGTIRSVTETIGNPIQALGKTHLLLKANSLAAILEITLLPFIAKFFGITGVGIWVCFSQASQCFILIPFLVRQLNITSKQLLGIGLPVIIAATVGSITSYLIPLSDIVWWASCSIRLMLFALVYILTHELLSGNTIWIEAKEQALGLKIKLSRQ